MIRPDCNRITVRYGNVYQLNLWNSGNIPPEQFRIWEILLQIVSIGEVRDSEKEDFDVVAPVKWGLTHCVGSDWLK